MDNNNKLPEGWGNSNNGDMDGAPWENTPKTTAWENSSQASPWENTNNTSENEDSKPKGIDTENVNAAFNKFANIAKKAGEKAVNTASDAAKKAADHAKSDEVTDKITAAKERVLSGASEVGNAVSGLGGKASAFISSQKNVAEKPPEDVSEPIDFPAETAETNTPAEEIIQDEVTEIDDVPEENVIEEDIEITLESEPSDSEKKPHSKAIKIITAAIAVIVVAAAVGAVCLKENQTHKISSNESKIVFEEEENTEQSVEKETEKEAENATEVETSLTQEVTTELAVEPINPTAKEYTESDIFNYPEYISVLEQIQYYNHNYAYNQCINNNVCIYYASDYIIYYYLCDINNDDSPELFVYASYKENSEHITLAEVYSIQNNNAVLLCQSAERWYYILYDNGCIGEYGSGGASLSSYQFYKYNGGIALDLIEEIICDANNYYLSTPTTNEESITESEFNNIIEKYVPINVNAVLIDKAVSTTEFIEPATSPLSDAEMGKMYNLFCFERSFYSTDGYIEDIDDDGLEDLIYKGYQGNYVVNTYKNGELTHSIIETVNASTPMLTAEELTKKCFEKANLYGFNINNNFVRTSSMIGYVNTQGGTLNLRSEPSTDSPVVTELPYGTFFNVYGTYEEAVESDWLLIDVKLSGNYFTGYVSKDYVVWVDTSI